MAIKSILLHQQQHHHQQQQTPKKSNRSQSVSSDSDMMEMVVDEGDDGTSITTSGPFMWMHQKLLEIPYLEELLPQIIVAMTKVIC